MRGSAKVAPWMNSVTGKFTSMPVRSMSSNGPMRKPQQSRITASIWAGVATFSCRIASPSVAKARPPKLTRKPGVSFTATGVRPRRLPRAVRLAITASVVSGPRITSTSFITGTGLKKCIPAIRSGCSMPAAIAPIGSDEVFEARIASGPATASRRLKTSRLTSSFSTMASTTASQPARSSRAPAGSMRPIAASVSTSSALPSATRFLRRAAIFSRALAAAPSMASNRRTDTPPWAATCAMPDPMAPAPTMPSM